MPSSSLEIREEHIAVADPGILDWGGGGGSGSPERKVRRNYQTDKQEKNPPRGVTPPVCHCIEGVGGGRRPYVPGHYNGPYIIKVPVHYKGPRTL